LKKESEALKKRGLEEAATAVADLISGTIGRSWKQVGNGEAVDLVNIDGATAGPILSSFASRPRYRLSLLRPHQVLRKRMIMDLG